MNKFAPFAEKTRLIQKCIGQVLKDRPIDPLVSHFSVRDDLFNSASQLVSLSQEGGTDNPRRRVGILVGFPCISPNLSPIPTETDGISGCVALAVALRSLGCDPFLLTDSINSPACFQALGSDSLGSEITLLDFPGVSHWSPKEEARLEEVGSTLDHLIAIERSGMAVDGNYYTMAGRSMNKEHVAPLERVLKYTPPTAPFTAIGDGGNELGMGKLYSAVKRNIPNGPKIACCVPADNLIVCGISNWGAYGLVFAMKLLLEKNKREGFRVPTKEQEKKIHLALCEKNPETKEYFARDGKLGEASLTLDGEPLDFVLNKIDALNQLVDDEP